MEKKLIFVPFAHDPNKRTGANMESNRDVFTVYCKNFCTALVSLKLDNPDCDVALVTNNPIPSEFSNILDSFNINIFTFPYDSFTFPADYTWSLAFYKLSALRSILVSTNYDFYCYLDTDIISNVSLAPVWQECKDHVLLYDINHGLNVKDYQLFMSDVNVFSGDSRTITHYGGEFFAASKNNGLIFLHSCEQIYTEILSRNFITAFGDEFILSLTADQHRTLVKNAGAYIFRYWTGQFYLSSTRHIANPISILHLPGEKNRGMIKIFDRYVAKGTFPSKKTIYRLCNIDRPYYLDVLKLVVKRLLRRA